MQTTGRPCGPGRLRLHYAPGLTLFRDGTWSPLLGGQGRGRTADLPIQDRLLGSRPGTSRHRLLPAPRPPGTSGRFRSLVAVSWWIMGVNRGLAGRRARLKTLRGFAGDGVPRHVILEREFDPYRRSYGGLARSGLDRSRLRSRRRSELARLLTAHGRQVVIVVCSLVRGDRKPASA